ncbi:MAG: hypothetical protein WCY11_12960 [Novosphingobium sp.]
MDSFRGHFSGYDTSDSHDSTDDFIDREPPPMPIGQDERRMQVRAYNFWASLLDDRTFPSIEDLDPANLPDFGPYSVLLDFTSGMEDPAIPFLGDRIAAECGGSGPIRQLSDVPSRSLLSRITDHYMQILANQAPIGFEAEFVNQHGATVLYRGILLPFSSDDETIDFIYGVINWKELADQQTSDELLLDIDRALDVRPETARATATIAAPLTAWADGPTEGPAFPDDDVLDLSGFAESEELDIDLPAPEFGSGGDPLMLSLADEAPEDDAFVMPSTLADMPDHDMQLADWLASARELAQAAQGSEDRSRGALYAAIGLAYDFSLAATAAPVDFRELIADAGLTVQERAPMTPIVKLVFGADYDKTRITEYATALSHAHRIGLERGRLTGYLVSAPGGLKGVVTAERKLKREEAGKTAMTRETPRETLARKLRKLEHFPIDAVAAEGHEFTLLVARRLPDGSVAILGEVSDDVPLLEKVAKRLLD